MPTYMTAKERKRMNAQFQAMLQITHNNLFALCEPRFPETAEAVLEANPNCANPTHLAGLNKRLNAQSERIQNLMAGIDPRFKYFKNN